MSQDNINDAHQSNQSKSVDDHLNVEAANEIIKKTTKLINQLKAQQSQLFYLSCYTMFTLNSDEQRDQLEQTKSINSLIKTLEASLQEYDPAKSANIDLVWGFFSLLSAAYRRLFSSDHDAPVSSSNPVQTVTSLKNKFKAWSVENPTTLFKPNDSATVDPSVVSKPDDKLEITIVYSASQVDTLNKDKGNKNRIIFQMVSVKTYVVKLFNELSGEDPPEPGVVYIQAISRDELGYHVMDSDGKMNTGLVHSRTLMDLYKKLYDETVTKDIQDMMMMKEQLRRDQITIDDKTGQFYINLLSDNTGESELAEQSGVQSTQDLSHEKEQSYKGGQANQDPLDLLPIKTTEEFPSRLLRTGLRGELSLKILLDDVDRRILSKLNNFRYHGDLIQDLENQKCIPRDTESTRSFYVDCNKRLDLGKLTLSSNDASQTSDKFTLGFKSYASHKEVEDLYRSLQDKITPLICALTSYTPAEIKGLINCLASANVSVLKDKIEHCVDPKKIQFKLDEVNQLANALHKYGNAQLIAKLNYIPDPETIHIPKSEFLCPDKAKGLLDGSVKVETKTDNIVNELDTILNATVPR